MGNKPDIKKLYDSKTISDTVKKIAERISKDYRDKKPLIVGVLNGSFIFLADLVRNLDIKDMNLDFIRLTSYRSTQSNKNPELIYDISKEIEGRHVIIVEDIVDTGNSLLYLINHLSEKNPESLRICALIDKKERRECSITVDYPGFNLQNGFVIGYGMDYNGWGRNLGEIYIIKE